MSIPFFSSLCLQPHAFSFHDGFFVMQQREFAIGNWDDATRRHFGYIIDESMRELENVCKKSTVNVKTKCKEMVEGEAGEERTRRARKLHVGLETK